MDTEPRQSANGIQRGLQVDRHRGVRRTRLDHRTRTGRRAKELREHYTAALGERELTVELLAAISRAAELQAISEQLRADAVRGLPVSPDDLVRIERLTSSALRALHLPNAASKQTPSLAEIIREHEGAQ